MSDIKVGDKVIDNVTGLKGTTVAKCLYLNGCVQFLVQPKVRDDRIIEGYWIDESQLKLVKPPVPKKEEYRISDGGGVRCHPSKI